MKISVAQIKSIKGDIQENFKIHKTWIQLAISENVGFIAFPELSLTGYEPGLAGELAMDKYDSRLDEFQNISDLNGIAIGIGVPTKSERGILISMILFQPNQNRKIYSKQRLHPDELPYFVEGDSQLVLTVENKKIAPAICYESLQKQHPENAKKLGADFYLASVSKSQNGIEKAFVHYPAIAREFNMPVLMSNCIGFCDDFQSAGQSAIWNSNGDLIVKLGSNKEGMLIFDTESKQVLKKEKHTASTM